MSLSSASSPTAGTLRAAQAWSDLPRNESKRPRRASQADARAQQMRIEFDLEQAHSLDPTIETALRKGHHYGKENAPSIIRVVVPMTLAATMIAATSGSPLTATVVAGTTLLSTILGGVAISIGKEEGYVSKAFVIAGVVVPLLIPNLIVDKVLANAIRLAMLYTATLSQFANEIGSRGDTVSLPGGLGLGATAGYMISKIAQLPEDEIRFNAFVGALTFGTIIGAPITFYASKLGQLTGVRNFIGNLTGKMMAVQTAISNRSCR